jgi:uncharacterized membrane protein YGL010W
MKAIFSFLTDYCKRHAHPFNAILHIIGVPAAFTGLYFICVGQTHKGLALLTLGYFFQYLGHEAQGNEVGEITLIKTIMNKNRTDTNSSKSVN